MLKCKATGGTMLLGLRIWHFMFWLFTCRHLSHHHPHVVIPHLAVPETCYFPDWKKTFERAWFIYVWVC